MQDRFGPLLDVETPLAIGATLGEVECTYAEALFFSLGGVFWEVYQRYGRRLSSSLKWLAARDHALALRYPLRRARAQLLSFKHHPEKLRADPGGKRLLAESARTAAALGECARALCRALGPEERRACAEGYLISSAHFYAGLVAGGPPFPVDLRRAALYRVRYVEALARAPERLAPTPLSGTAQDLLRRAAGARDPADPQSFVEAAGDLARACRSFLTARDYPPLVDDVLTERRIKESHGSVPR